MERERSADRLQLLAVVALGASSIVLFAGYRYAEPPWVQERGVLVLVFGLALAYSVGLALVRSDFLRVEGSVSRVARILAIGSLTCLPVLAVAMLDKLVFRQFTVLLELGLVFSLLLVNGGMLSNRIATVISVLIFVVAIQPSLSKYSRESLVKVMSRSEDRSVPSEFVFSSLYDLKITHNPLMSRLDVSGGGIEPIDESQLLLVDGYGTFRRLSLVDGIVKAESLPVLTTRMNRADYEEDADFPQEWFRVTDILLAASNSAEEKVLYVAHHQWDRENQCLTLNVDEARLDLQSLSTPLRWQTRFESTPCVPPRTMTNETGGRLALRSPNSLLLTVGITVVGSEFHQIAQDDLSAYGKVIEIDRSDWTSRILTKGHRNPQGLLVDGDRLWLTEHGPDGGDELNLIEDGENYGWPLSSYGTDYGVKTLVGNETPGDHSIGRRPVFSWVPSIGISNLLKIQGDLFSKWQGDLVISSLSGRGNGQSLFRLRFVEDQVQLVERIRTGLDVRDIAEMPSGVLVLWNGRGIVQTVSPASHVFSQCTPCHAMNPGWQHGIGPDLLGVVGSPVARHANYQYSDSMRRFGGRWSRDRLDEFLRDPQRLVPGTTMTSPGIEDEAMRAELIDYLSEMTRDAEQ